MFFKNKDKFSYKDEELNEVFFFFEPRKIVKVKPIESYKPIVRYQAVIILFPNMGLI